MCAWDRSLSHSRSFQYSRDFASFNDPLDSRDVVHVCMSLSCLVSVIPECVTWAWLRLISFFESLWLDGSVCRCCSLRLRSECWSFPPTQTRMASGLSLCEYFVQLALQFFVLWNPSSFWQLLSCQLSLSPFLWVSVVDEVIDPGCDSKHSLL